MNGGPPAINDSFLWPALLWLVLCGAWAVWLLRPVRRSNILPPWRRYAVPWSSWEVILALLLGMILWQQLLTALLTSIKFFGWVYGPEFQTQLAREARQG